MIRIDVAAVAATAEIEQQCNGRKKGKEEKREKYVVCK